MEKTIDLLFLIMACLGTVLCIGGWYMNGKKLANEDKVVKIFGISVAGIIAIMIILFILRGLV